MRRMTIREVAREADLAESTVYRFEANKTALPRADTLQALARALQTTTDELLGIQDQTVPLGELVELPLVVEIAAGDNPRDVAEETILVPAAALPEGIPHDQLFAIYVTDDLLHPELCEGDLAVAALDVEIGNAHLAVVTNDRTIIRRIYRLGEEICATSDLPAHPPDHMPATCLVARVMKSIRDH